MFECYLTSKWSLSLACGQAGSSLFSFNFLNIKQCFVFPENNCPILKSNENWKKMIFTILLSRQSVRSYFQIYEIIHSGQEGQFFVIYKSIDFMQRSLSFSLTFSEMIWLNVCQIRRFLSFLYLEYTKQANFLWVFAACFELPSCWVDIKATFIENGQLCFVAESESLNRDLGVRMSLLIHAL